jgi:hypothetical protein
MAASMKVNPWDRALANCCKALRAEFDISPETQKLITLATYDLYYGPEPANSEPTLKVRDEYGNENEWAGYPGFVTACRRLREALFVDLPGQVWWDEDTGILAHSEPQPADCGVCNGEGYIDGTDEPFCTECSGRGQFEADGDWYVFERRDLLRGLVGHELAAYL